MRVAREKLNKNYCILIGAYWWQIQDCVSQRNLEDQAHVQDSKSHIVEDLFLSSIILENL